MIIVRVMDMQLSEGMGFSPAPGLTFVYDHIVISRYYIR